MKPVTPWIANELLTKVQPQNRGMAAFLNKLSQAVKIRLPDSESDMAFNFEVPANEAADIMNWNPPLASLCWVEGSVSSKNPILFCPDETKEMLKETDPHRIQVGFLIEMVGDTHEYIVSYLNVPDCMIFSPAQIRAKIAEKDGALHVRWIVERSSYYPKEFWDNEDAPEAACRAEASGAYIAASMPGLFSVIGGLPLEDWTEIKITRH